MADELNVGDLEPLSAAGADLVDHSAKGNFRALGKRFGEGHTPGRRRDRGGRRPVLAARRWRPTAGPRSSVDGRAGRGTARRGDRLRATARGLVRGQRAGRDGRARPRADPRAACAPVWPARSCGWCRRRASPAASTSRTGSRFAGRRRASSPRPSASTRELISPRGAGHHHHRGRRRRGASSRPTPTSGWRSASSGCEVGSAAHSLSWCSFPWSSGTEVRRGPCSPLPRAAPRPHRCRRGPGAAR